MKPIKILLVEDNEGDIMLTREAFQEGRIANEIEVVRDGWEAIKYLKKEGKYIDIITPDIVILDVNLPKLNGHEVLKRIKHDEALKSIPVIMLSTSSSEADINSSYNSYANCYITKPVDVNDFFKVVTSIEHFWLSIVTLPVN